jgi:lipopolysaccharide export system permease protein
MRLIERYIFRRAGATFLLSLAALVGVVWATQALRQMNIVTAKGAALLVFLEITALALPFLTIVVAPFALLIACIQTLNSLNAESETVVLSASGASRFVVLKPLLALAGLVATAMLIMSLWLSPTSLRMLREQLTRVNVDLVSNIVQPGRFIPIEKGLTFHIRNRAGDGTLGGLFVEDARDPELAFTYVAEKASIVEMFGKTLLVMRDGVIQRRTARDGNLSLIDFQSYAFDLSAMTPQSTAPVFRPSERSTEELWTLGGPNPDSYARNNVGRLRSELHDRLSQPLLPIAFALVSFLALGDARTTREGRGVSIIGAIVVAGVIRGGDFAATSAAATSGTAVLVLYALSALIIGGALFLIATDRNVALPLAMSRAMDAGAERCTWLAGWIGRRLGLDNEREPS